MGLTQPAISRAVARLEERVGIRIFNRTARAISLTDEGRQFYEAVAPLLAGIEDAAVSAGKNKGLVRGRLRVNVDGTFGHYVLAPRLGDFLDRYPELSVEVSVRDSMGDLVGEGIDVAVRFGAPEPCERETPSTSAAFRKLRCSATATRAARSVSVGLAIGHPCSPAHAD